jgi:hypothetical protein
MLQVWKRNGHPSPAHLVRRLFRAKLDENGAVGSVLSTDPSDVQLASARRITKSSPRVGGCRIARPKTAADVLRRLIAGSPILCAILAD